jgi:hypothetical protein
MNTIPDIENLYSSLGERDYEAVILHLGNDIVWIVADNSPFADRSPYRGIADVRSGIFDAVIVAQSHYSSALALKDLVHGDDEFVESCC